MKMYNDAKVDDLSENAIVQMLAGLFNDVTYMIPEDVRHSIQCMSEGGFSVEDRTYKTSVINYLISRFSLIFVGLLSNHEFRQAFIDAIAMEQNLEDQTPEQQAEIRADMNTVKIKNAESSPRMVVNFSHYNDSVFKKINAKLLESFNKMDGYDDAIDDMINHQTEDCKDEFGYIVSNFAYLIKAFDKDTVFFAYVSSVLKHVQNTMGLEY